VVSRLFQEPEPSAYVRSVATRVLAAFAAGAVVLEGDGSVTVHAGVALAPAAPGEPDALAALVAVVSLLAVPDSAGADVRTDSGTAHTSSVGASSAAAGMLRPALGARAAGHAAAASWLVALGRVAVHSGAGSHALSDAVAPPAAHLADAINL
jgi:hypothetical protein